MFYLPILTVSNLKNILFYWILKTYKEESFINSLNAELNLICHLLTLLGAHHIFHVSGLRVNMTILL